MTCQCSVTWMDTLIKKKVFTFKAEVTPKERNVCVSRVSQPDNLAPLRKTECVRGTIDANDEKTFCGNFICIKVSHAHSVLTPTSKLRVYGRYPWQRVASCCLLILLAESNATSLQSKCNCAHYVSVTTIL